MPKAIAIIVNVTEGPTSANLKLTTAVAVRPVAAETFAPLTFESNVLVTGTENAQQLNTVILTQVKADALTRGVTLLDADVTTTKFA